MAWWWDGYSFGSLLFLCSISISLTPLMIGPQCIVVERTPFSHLIFQVNSPIVPMSIKIPPTLPGELSILLNWDLSFLSRTVTSRK
jgi:hypothetical protein